MTVASTPFPSAPSAQSAGRLTSADAEVRQAIEAHYAPLWRFLRRMGVEEGHVEDAAQQVFVVFARRVSELAPAAVRSFLFGTALRVASDHRRRRAREEAGAEALGAPAHLAVDAEHELAQREVRALLDRVLDELPPELRAVFVLAELEEVTMAESARILGIPAGTVASRLRRAREVFAARAQELRRYVEKGGTP